MTVTVWSRRWGTSWELPSKDAADVRTPLGLGRRPPAESPRHGVPGGGRSTLARRCGDELALALALDVDVFRSQLGGGSITTSRPVLLPDDVEVTYQRLLALLGEDAAAR